MKNASKGAVAYHPCLPRHPAPPQAWCQLTDQNEPLTSLEFLAVRVLAKLLVKMSLA
jgi:hypothetical protein